MPKDTELQETPYCVHRFAPWYEVLGQFAVRFALQCAWAKLLENTLVDLMTCLSKLLEHTLYQLDKMLLISCITYSYLVI